VYPPGTSVIFSVATDSNIGPGVVNTSAATYTPQNDPHWYLCWYGQVLGPSINATEDVSVRPGGSPATLAFSDFRSALTTNLAGGIVTPKATSLTPLPAVSITTHAAITVEGVVGSQYGIQYKTDLNKKSDWQGLANIILTAPKQVYYDPLPGTGTQRYYRIVPGPIVIP
jgi:hypothetical protein